AFLPDNQRKDRRCNRADHTAECTGHRRRGPRMRRREFIALIGGAAAAWPVAARAQQALPVVWFLNNGSPDGYAPMVAAFRQGLQTTGYVEGQNVAVEYRWARGDNDLMLEMALGMVGRPVAVIFTNSPVAQKKLKAAITTIPIVFATGADPVKNGLVASLARP